MVSKKALLLGLCLLLACASMAVAADNINGVFSMGSRMGISIGEPGLQLESFEHAPTDVGLKNGRLYFDTTDGLQIRKGGAWFTVALGASAGNTLDQAYDQGGGGSGFKINADAGAVEIEVADTSNNDGLLIDFDDSTFNGDALVIENAGSGRDILAPSFTLTAGALVANTSVTTTAVIGYGAGANANFTLDAKGTGTIGIGATSTGKVTISPAAALNGNVDIGNAVTDTLTITSIIDGDVTLDDGTTHSPALIFKDATDELLTIVKLDSGYATFTTASADGVSIRVGNLTVGDGSAGVAAMDGEDAYIEGELEVDGAIQFDGALTTASTITAEGTVTLDDGTGASPDFILKDATDETATFSKVDSGYLTITTVAADGVSILVGNLQVGSGSAGVAAMDGEDVFIKGELEVDGAIQLDGTTTTTTLIVGTLLDVNENVDIDLDANDEFVTVDSTTTDYAAGAGIVTIHGDHAGNTNDAPLLRLVYQTDADAQDTFLLCEDNSTGAAANGDQKFKIGTDGAVSMAGTLTLTGGHVAVFIGGDLASPGGGELTLTAGTQFDVTGTNNITSIAAASSIAGRILILKFDAILTFTDGNNLKLAGNYVTTADDTIMLFCDGTDWWEMARSAN